MDVTSCMTGGEPENDTFDFKLQSQIKREPTLLCWRLISSPSSTQPVVNGQYLPATSGGISAVTAGEHLYSCMPFFSNREIRKGAPSVMYGSAAHQERLCKFANAKVVCPRAIKQHTSTRILSVERSSQSKSLWKVSLFHHEYHEYNQVI